MKIIQYTIITILPFMSLTSCQLLDKTASGEGAVIAEAYDKILFEGDIKSILPENISAQDSTAFVNSFIDRWIRDQVVIVEAEKYVAKDINIDRLVSDYRSSLLSYNYEKRLIEDRLDTVITEEAFQLFYEQEKEQFKLTEPLVLVERFKIPSKAKRIDAFFTNWRNKREKKIKKYIETHAIDYSIDTVNYMSVETLLLDLPSKFKAREFKKSSIQHYDAGYEYFVKVIDFKDKGEVPPLSYIRETLRKRILHDRKNALMQSVKQKLYDIAIETKQIKINNKD